MRAEVASFLVEKMGVTGNPSSVHQFGRQVRRDVELAREEVARLVGAETIDVTFTSGATEANNTVIFCAPVERVLFSAIEHPSVMDAAKTMPNHAEIPVLENGLLDMQALENLLRQSDVPTLVSVMWVNNETGIIQPVQAIAAMAKQHGALFHCDAVQAVGRVPVAMHDIGIDYLSCSAHKIGGPAGIGALVYGQDIPLGKFLHGGGQERRRRAGTENTLGILGFGKAAALALRDLDQIDVLRQRREELEDALQQAVPSLKIIGRDSPRVANTIQMVLPAAPAEKQLMALDLAGIAVSSGSACSSGSIKPSHVLLAMGLAADEAKCAIRLSMGPETGPEALKRFLETWVAISQRLLSAVSR